MTDKHGQDGKADAPAASAPAKKAWSKPRMTLAYGIILEEVKSGATAWAPRYEDEMYHPES